METGDDDMKINAFRSQQPPLEGNPTQPALGR